MAEVSILPETHMKEACAELSIQVPQIITVEGFRWTLEQYLGLGTQMIKLERILQSKTKRPIDLRLESLSDKNRRKQRNVLSAKI